MRSVYVASLIAAIVAFAIAALWAVTGIAGLVGKLPGNSWTGVRSPATRKSEPAWHLAQKVAAPGYLAGAVSLTFGGILALVNRWGFLFALGGLVVGFLAVAVVSGIAVKAADAAVAAEAPADSGCSSGCCSGGDAQALREPQGADGELQGAGADGDAEAAAAADCGESSCGSCALSGMCLPESDEAHSQHVAH